MFDLTSVPLLDNHSHAGLYERRKGRNQTLSDLLGDDGHYRTSAYQSLLRQALSDLHGAEENWNDGVTAQYVDGLPAAYMRIFDRLDIRATLWDFRRLERAGWPVERFHLVYWIDPFICPFVDSTFHRANEMQAALTEALH